MNNVLVLKIFQFEDALLKFICSFRLCYATKINKLACLMYFDDSVL